HHGDAVPEGEEAGAGAVEGIVVPGACLRDDIDAKRRQDRARDYVAFLEEGSQHVPPTPDCAASGAPRSEKIKVVSRSVRCGSYCALSIAREEARECPCSVRSLTCPGGAKREPGPSAKFAEFAICSSRIPAFRLLRSLGRDTQGL